MPVLQLTKPGPNASAHVWPLPSVLLGTKAPDCRFSRGLGCLKGDESTEKEEEAMDVLIDRRITRSVGTMLGKILFPSIDAVTEG